jgi:glycosyltransferase involved in cell wall biosynthesis
MKVSFVGPVHGGIHQHAQHLKDALEGLDEGLDISYHCFEKRSDVSADRILGEDPDIIHIHTGEGTTAQYVIPELEHENTVMSLHETNLRLLNKGAFEKGIKTGVSIMGGMVKSKFLDQYTAMSPMFWDKYMLFDKLLHRSSLKCEKNLKYLKKAKHLFVLSDFAKRCLTDKGLESTVIMHPPNIAQYDLPEERRQTLCKKYGAEDGFLLANPGYYPLRWKSYKTLIDAAKELEDLDVEIIMTGRDFGSIGFRDHYDFGRATIKLRSVGYVPEEEMSFLLGDASALVLAYEPNVGFHQSGIVPAALSHGTPVVATDAGGLREYVKDAGIITPYDPVRLADGIRAMVTDDEMREKMGYKALEISERLSWEDNAKSILEVYQRIV